MAHQFADGHRVVRLLHDYLAVGTRRLGHLQVGELRNELRDRIVEFESTFLVERHQRRAGHGLGHRVDAEDRVPGHGGAARDVLLAEGAEVRDLAVPRNDGHDAGEFPSVDESLHGGVQFREAFGAHADFGGVDDREIAFAGVDSNGQAQSDGQRQCPAGECVDQPVPIHGSPPVTRMAPRRCHSSQDTVP